MKISMKVMLMSVLMIFAVTAMNAQSKLEQKAQAETDEIAEAIDLNEDVKAKVFEVILASKKASKKVSKAFKAGEIEKVEKKEQMKAIGKQKNEDLKALFTKEQKQAYTAFKKEQKAAKKQ